ncbi:MAG: response regulator [bacterium]
MAKVFLVDDDVDLVEQNRLVLVENGHTVITANTAKEALVKLKTEKPDIMIVDVMMEHRTAGFALAREIGKNFPSIPLIIMSGATDKVNWMGESNDTWGPVINFLDKPVDPDKLAKVVAEALKK